MRGEYFVVPALLANALTSSRPEHRIQMLWVQGGSGKEAQENRGME